MYYTDDPMADYERHAREEQRRLKRLPVCAYCDHHISDEYYFEINEEILCKRCLYEYHRKRNEMA